MNRAEYIQQIIEEYRGLLARGLSFELETACAQHPDLMPELRTALQELQAGFDESEQPWSSAPDASLSGFATVDFPADAPRSSAPGSAPGDRLRYMGEYRLEKLLGEGSFGQVWRGTQLTLNRAVAIKLLKGEYQSTELIARFRREAKLLARLKHPNIVSVLEVNEQNGVHYIAMEFVDGSDLRRYIQQGLPTIQWAAQAMRTVALAISHAHNANLIHRDLKPANILVDEESQIKVTDFGLAKQTTDGTELTATNAVVGTIAYMAPEQAEGNHAAIGPAADIYAIGATLYHLLTGRPPFPSHETTSDIAILTEVRERDATPPRRRRPDRMIPLDLDTICVKCLEKDPAARYASAAALAADLQRFLDGEPILARPIPIWERWWRKAKRRPQMAALIAALVLVTIIGSAAAWGLSKKTTALSQEVQTVKREKSEVEVAKTKAEAERATATALAQTKTEESVRTRKEKAWQEYIADLQAVEHAWESGNVVEVRELLAKHVPTTGSAEEDLRGIEWHYWNHLLNSTSRAFPNARGRSAAIDPSGRYLAVANDTHVSVWEIATGQQFQKWPIAQGKQSNVLDSADRHTDFDHSVAFSPDGKLLAATNYRLTRDKRLGSLRVWEVATKEERMSIQDDPAIGGRAVIFSPDNRLILAGGYGHAYRAWDLSSKQPVAQPLRPGEENPIPPHVKPSTPWSGAAVVWDMDFWGDILMLRCDALGPGFPEWSKKNDHPAPRVYSEVLMRLRRTPDLETRTTYGYKQHLFAAVRNNDDTLDLLQMGTPAINGVEVKRMEGGPVSAVAIEDYWVVAAGKDRVIRIWEVLFPGQPRELRGSESQINGLALSQNRKLLVTLPETRVWQLDQQAEFQIPLAPKNPRTAIQIDSPGWRFAVRAGSGRSQLVATEGERTIFDVPTEYLLGAWFSPDEKRVAISLQQNKRSFTQLWDLTTETQLAELPMFGRTICGGAFSSDSQWVAGHGRVWNANTGELLLDCGNQITQAVAFSPSNRLVAFVNNGGTQVWDVNAGKSWCRLPAGGVAAAFQSDEKQLLVTGPVTTVWDLDSLQEVSATFGSDRAESVAVSQDGRRVYFLRPNQLRVYSNKSWNHLLTLTGPLPRTASEVDACLEKMTSTASN